LELWIKIVSSIDSHDVLCLEQVGCGDIAQARIRSLTTQRINSD
jgi:hypothetical protein